MGQPKALLDRDGVPFVTHVAAVAATSVGGGPVVVAGGIGQELPALDPVVELVVDAVPDGGPLQGLLAGLQALAGRADVAYVVATDLPLLLPELGRALLEQLDEGDDIVVPVAHGHRHPLTAVYRVDLASTVAELLAEGSGKAGLLLDRCRARFVTEQELLSDRRLATVDPGLESLLNVNTADDLERARTLWRARRDGIR